MTKNKEETIRERIKLLKSFVSVCEKCEIPNNREKAMFCGLCYGKLIKLVDYNKSINLTKLL